MAIRFFLLDATQRRGLVGVGISELCLYRHKNASARPHQTVAHHPNQQHIHPGHPRIRHAHHGDHQHCFVRLAQVQVGAVAQRQPADGIGELNDPELNNPDPFLPAKNRGLSPIIHPLAG
jgi:hypothetical protein